jgi:hypothetical protein
MLKKIFHEFNKYTSWRLGYYLLTFYFLFIPMQMIISGHFKH